MPRRRLGLWRVATARAQSKPKGRPYQIPRVPRMTPAQYAERQRALKRNGDIIEGVLVKGAVIFFVAFSAMVMAFLLLVASAILRNSWHTFWEPPYQYHYPFERQ